MQLGSVMLHVDWLDGRTLKDWQFGGKTALWEVPTTVFLIKFVLTRFSINRDFHPHHYLG
jgi:hypothetical protein